MHSNALPTCHSERSAVRNLESLPSKEIQEVDSSFRDFDEVSDFDEVNELYSTLRSE